MPLFPSDVSEEQAIELLAACQECSRYFSDFDFQQLITLAKELTILNFKERETVLFQGEPATFFGVVLKGALVPVVGGARQVGSQRGIGEVIGEMALFSGGTRNVSIEAAQDGFLAVFSFAQLEALVRTNRTLYEKLSRQLALAALEKQTQTNGGHFNLLSEAEVEHGVQELLQRRAQQHWDSARAVDLAKGESLLNKHRRYAHTPSALLYSSTPDSSPPLCPRLEPSCTPDPP